MSLNMNFRFYRLIFAAILLFLQLSFASSYENEGAVFSCKDFSDEKSLAFTEAERALVQKFKSEKKVLNVLSRAKGYPLSFEENGRLQGFLPDMFALAMKRTGLNYKFHWHNSIYSYEKDLAEASVDIVLDRLVVPGDSSFGRFKPSVKVQALDLSFVHRKGAGESAYKIAVVRSLLNVVALDPDLDSTRLVFYNGVEEAVNAVAVGEADGAYVPFFMASPVVESKFYNKLVYGAIPSVLADVVFSVSEKAPAELSSVLAKSFCMVPLSDLEGVENNVGNAIAKNLSMWEYFRCHPIFISILFVVIAILLFIIGVAIVQNKMKCSELNRVLWEQDKLKHDCAEAVAANVAKSKFLFNMSHDIRTPMNAIIGFVDKAERNIENTEVVLDSIRKCRVSGNYLLQLINEVLDMARIESNKIALIEDVYDLVAQGTSLCTTFEHSFEEKKITFESDFSGVKDKFVFQDAQRVRQIMTNILSNAVKYTARGGSIEYRIEQLPSEREGFALYGFSVKDSGIGMSKNFLAHIYDEFSRESSSLLGKTIGTGLGMSIVKRVVDMMGGKIDIDSAPGRGTTVSVYLSFKIARGNDVERFKKREPVGDPNALFVGKRVLLVEDNEFNREIAADLLREVGLMVDCAEDGKQAVDRIRLRGIHYYDCIFMDIQMPVMDGYEATREIRKMFPDEYIPIIALSANAFEEDKQKSLEMGMYDHLSKPIVAADLLDSMKRLMCVEK